MTRLRLTLIGVIAAVLLCAGAAFADNPGTANRTSTGDTGFSAIVDSPFLFVNATLAARQYSGYARVTVTASGRNTNNYDGTAQIRCNGSATIFVDTFGGAFDTSGTRTCSGTGNAWAGTIAIY